MTVAVAHSLPFVRLDRHDDDLFAELMAAVERVAASSAFTLGDEVEAFEHEFARFCGAGHARGVASGTDAIVLSLRALGIGWGDEVMVPSNSFIATAEAVSLVGATPRLVDVDRASGLLTADIVAAGLTPSTACVIPVHLYGATVDMAPIMRVARKAGIAVVEDACQAHGAETPEGRVGTLGDLGCFSFYPTKNLGGWGDGGAVITGHPELAERISLLRSHGEFPSRRHSHLVVGATARLDGIQAAVLRVKLRRLEEWNDTRRELAARLGSALAGAALELPLVPCDGDHVFHLFVVRSLERDGLRAQLAEAGVATAVHYPTPIHLTEAYADPAQPKGSLPAAEELAGRICSLPLFPAMAEGELERLAEAVLAARPAP